MTKKSKYKITRQFFGEEVFVEIMHKRTRKRERIQIFKLALNKKIIKNLLPEDALLIGYMLCEANVNLELIDNSQYSPNKQIENALLREPMKNIA